MSHRIKSPESRELANERRATNRERTLVRHAERRNKHTAALRFGGAL